MRKPLLRQNPRLRTAVGAAEKVDRDESPAAHRPGLNRSRSYYRPDEFADREFPLIYKPKVIKKIGDYCYIFHCTVKGNTGARFNKNMAVLVHEGSLTLVNPLRLTPEGDSKLLSLGANPTVSHILRMGPSEHAAFEDGYYLTRFEHCQRWAPGHLPGCPDLPLHHRLWDTSNTRTTMSLDAPISPPSPHPDVLVFVFEETVEPECLLYLIGKRTLIVGDCLQHQVDNPFVDAAGTANLLDNGLLRAKVVLSERWVASQTVLSNNSQKLEQSYKTRAQRAKAFFGNGTGKTKLRLDFQRLLKLDIDRLTSTSGNLVLQNEVQDGVGTTIKEEIEAAVDRVCVMTLIGRATT